MELCKFFLTFFFITIFFLFSNSYASNMGQSIILHKTTHKICHIPKNKTKSCAIDQVNETQVCRYCKKKSNFNKTIFEEQLIKSHTTSRQNYLLAAGETAAFLIGYTIRYYNNHEFNAIDWDFDLHSSIKSRLSGDAVRFDDNEFNTNVGHFFAGSGYYLMARLNGLNRLSSLLYTTAASSIWEYVTEFREVVSINDQINTILGGFVLGETYNEVIKIFQYLPPTRFNNALKTVVKAPKSLLDWISDMVYKDAPSYDVDSSYAPWSKFDLFSGYFTTQYELPRLFTDALVRRTSNLSGFYFGLNAQFIDIPMFEQVGEIKDFLTDDVFGQFIVEDYYNSNLNTFNLFAKTTLGAYYSKKLLLDRNGCLRGYNLFIGPSSALQIKNDDVLNDFYTALHLLGLTVDLTTYINNFRIRGIFDIYGDFSMMNAFAFRRYKTENDVQHEQSVLKNHGYYYGAGYTTDGLLVMNFKRWEIGGGVININANMISSRSRFFRPHTGCGGWCERESSKLNLSDFRLNTYAWTSLRIINNFKLQLSVQKNEITGTLRGWGNENRSATSKAITLVYSLQT